MAATPRLMFAPKPSVCSFSITSPRSVGRAARVDRQHQLVDLRRERVEAGRGSGSPGVQITTAAVGIARERWQNRQGRWGLDSQLARAFSTWRRMIRSSSTMRRSPRAACDGPRLRSAPAADGNFPVAPARRLRPSRARRELGRRPSGQDALSPRAAVREDALPRRGHLRRRRARRQIVELLERFDRRRRARSEPLTGRRRPAGLVPRAQHRRAGHPAQPAHAAATRPLAPAASG